MCIRDRDWLLTENDLDGNLIADGHGMMEIQGLDTEMIDVASYSQRAFSDAAIMAKILGKAALSKEYENKAFLLKGKINTIFWDEEFQSYADFLSTKEQALKLADDAIERAFKLKNIWAVDELKAVSYTHLRAHETVLDIVCRLLLATKKYTIKKIIRYFNKST